MLKQREQTDITITDLLAVWDKNHLIYIIPSKEKIENLTMDTYDKEAINVENKVFFHTPRCNQALEYVKNNIDSYPTLLVLEEYFIDEEKHHLLRGIIYGDSHNIEFSLNPEFTITLSRTLSEKALRFSGCYVPQPYLLKRDSKKY